MATKIGKFSNWMVGDGSSAGPDVKAFAGEILDAQAATLDLLLDQLSADTATINNDPRYTGSGKADAKLRLGNTALSGVDGEVKRRRPGLAKRVEQAIALMETGSVRVWFKFLTGKVGGPDAPPAMIGVWGARLQEIRAAISEMTDVQKRLFLEAAAAEANEESFVAIASAPLAMKSKMPDDELVQANLQRYLKNKDPQKYADGSAATAALTQFDRNTTMSEGAIAQLTGARRPDAIARAAAGLQPA